MSMTAYNTLVFTQVLTVLYFARAPLASAPRAPQDASLGRAVRYGAPREETRVGEAHARRAKGNPVPIPEPGSGTAYNSGPRKSVRRGNPK